MLASQIVRVCNVVTIVCKEARWLKVMLYWTVPWSGLCITNQDGGKSGFTEPWANLNLTPIQK